jgi:hypothetical protein
MMFPVVKRICYQKLKIKFKRKTFIVRGHQQYELAKYMYIDEYLYIYKSVTNYCVFVSEFINV